MHLSCQQGPGQTSGERIERALGLGGDHQIILEATAQVKIVKWRVIHPQEDPLEIEHRAVPELGELERLADEIVPVGVIAGQARRCWQPRS